MYTAEGSKRNKRRGRLVLGQSHAQPQSVVRRGVRLQIRANGAVYNAVSSDSEIYCGHSVVMRSFFNFSLGVREKYVRCVQHSCVDTCGGQTLSRFISVYSRGATPNCSRHHLAPTNFPLRVAAPQDRWRIRIGDVGGRDTARVTCLTVTVKHPKIRCEASLVTFHAMCCKRIETCATNIFQAIARAVWAHFQRRCVQ